MGGEAAHQRWQLLHRMLYWPRLTRQQGLLDFSWDSQMGSQNIYQSFKGG